MEKKPIVHLRVYRGGDLNYTQDGKVKNENQSVKITHDTVEWANFLKHLKANQYGKVEVERVLDGATLKPVDDFEAIKKEVSIAFNGPTKEASIDPRDAKIAELQEQMKALLESNKGGAKAPSDAPKSDVPKATPAKTDTPPADDEDLKKARAEYQEVFGKKGGTSWTAEQIREKIAEEKAKK